MTQEELAERAGFHPTYIQKVEAARICPSLEAIGRLAEALRVSVASIVSAVEEPVGDEKEQVVQDVAELLRRCPEAEVRFVHRFVEFLRQQRATPNGRRCGRGSDEPAG